jgi:Tfp pilus assembly protein PilF
MGISTLNFSLSFTLALILISSIIIVSFKTDEVDATIRVPKVANTSCSEPDREDEKTNKASYRFTEKGNDFYEIGNNEKALIYYNLAIKKDPNNAAALHNKGNALHNLERYEEAIEYYDKALDEDPDYASAFHGKGIAHSALEKYEEAIEYYELALDAEPDYAQALKSIGNAYYNLGQYQKAIEYYDKALDEDPNCDSALTWKNNAQDKLDNNTAPKRRVVRHVINEEPSTNATFTGGNATSWAPSDSDSDNKCIIKGITGSVITIYNSRNISPDQCMPLNNPPVASASSMTTTTNKPIDIQLLASDKDNDELTASIVSTPSNGVLSGINQENGMVTYTSNSEFIGTDTFTFKVNDGKIDSNSGLVTIAVEQEPVNHPPSASDKKAATNSDTPIVITLPFSDVDQNDKLISFIVSHPSNGNLGNIDQILDLVTYTPNSGFSGTDTFTFKVNDGQIDSNIATVSLTIKPDQEQQQQQEEQERPSRIPAPTPLPPPQPEPVSITDELTKIADLKDKGIISEEEFNTLKNDLLKNEGIISTNNIVNNGNDIPIYPVIKEDNKTTTGITNPNDIINCEKISVAQKAISSEDNLNNCLTGINKDNFPYGTEKTEYPKNNSTQTSTGPTDIQPIIIGDTNTGPVGISGGPVIPDDTATSTRTGDTGSTSTGDSPSSGGKPESPNRSIKPEIVDHINIGAVNITDTEKINTDVGGQPIPFQFIVIFDDKYMINPASLDTTFQALSLIVERLGGEVIFTYNYTIRGFAFKTVDQQKTDQILEILTLDPRVKFAEQDKIVVPFSQQEIPSGIQRIGIENTVVMNSSIEHVGIDADIALIDSGIDLDHPDLNVFKNITSIIPQITTSQEEQDNTLRATDIDLNKIGLNVENNLTTFYPPFSQELISTGDDNCGHGTHVAGTAAAKDNAFGVLGVAPGAKLWAIKVLDYDKDSGKCFGSISSVIAAIDYVTKNADQIDVANLSLGCKCNSTALDEAITKSVRENIVYVTAAGNINTDASFFSPANHKEVLTVSAITDSDGKCGSLGTPIWVDAGDFSGLSNDDTFASFSNYGSVVDIAAPGVKINSTYINGTYALMGGTSIASPHVTGLVALYKSINPTASPKEISEEVTSRGLYPNAVCDGQSYGYFDLDLDNNFEPLLYLFEMGKIKAISHRDLEWVLSK